jgi:hypothetical protein
MITLTRLDTAAELAEALYYAHASAVIVTLENPSAAPKPAEWDELPADIRALWNQTATRLLALNS